MHVPCLCTLAYRVDDVTGTKHTGITVIAFQSVLSIHSLDYTSLVDWLNWMHGIFDSISKLASNTSVDCNAMAIVYKPAFSFVSCYCTYIVTDSLWY
jgi:hypothetical protein